MLSLWQGEFWTAIMREWNNSNFMQNCIKNFNKTLYFFAKGCIVVLGVHLWKSNDKE